MNRDSLLILIQSSLEEKEWFPFLKSLKFGYQKFMPSKNICQKKKLSIYKAIFFSLLCCFILRPITGHGPNNFQVAPNHFKLSVFVSHNCSETNEVTLR